MQDLLKLPATRDFRRIFIDGKLRDNHRQNSRKEGFGHLSEGSGCHSGLHGFSMRWTVIGQGIIIGADHKGGLGMALSRIDMGNRQ
jgi:hypothetical protein